MQIWKWDLDLAGEQTLELPVGAAILTVQLQHDVPRLWALCDEKESVKVKRRFAIYVTGHPMPNEPGHYIGTFQLHGGSLVFHVFEIIGE